MLGFIFLVMIVAGASGWATRRRDVRPGPWGGPRAGLPDPRQVLDVRDDGIEDARAEADHWIRRLGAGLTRLDGARPADPQRAEAARDALSEAAERHVSARDELARATTRRTVELAGLTAIEGLHYLRAARTALGLDPGPEVPAPSGHRLLTDDRAVTVQDRTYQASPRPGAGTPYYYPGGAVGGRSVPAGWYDRPWWRTALIGGAAGLGSLMVMDALFDSGPFDGGLIDVDGLGDFF